MALNNTRSRLMRLRRLCHAAAISALPRRAMLGYIGMVGWQNLGDEAMFAVLRRELAPLSLFPSMGLRPIEKRMWSLACRRAFAGCVLGGGTMIFSDNAFEYLTRALDAGLPCWILGSGVRSPAFWAEHSPDRLYSPDRWVEALRECRFVGVRGPLSARYLEEAGFLGAEVIGDPVLLIAGQQPAKPSVDKILGLNWGSSGNLVWGGDERTPLQALVSTIREALEQGWQVRLFCAWPGDRHATEQLRAELRLPASAVIHEYSNPHKFMKKAAYCSIFVGMKLHAVALALCAGVPALMIEYRPKCRDFMTSLGLEDSCVRINELNATSLKEQMFALTIPATCHVRVSELQVRLGRTAERIRDHVASFLDQKRARS